MTDDRTTYSERTGLVAIDHKAELLSCDSWTVARPVSGRYAYCHTSNPVYGVVGLTVEPYDGPEELAFLFAAPRDEQNFAIYGRYPSEEDMAGFVTGVVQGIEDALQEKAQEGITLSSLLITVTEMPIHWKDSVGFAYRRASKEALRQCLSPENLVHVAA